ncbi:OmpH family outer membrane protein [Blastomonas marina]|uniref:OmpH family outer membrane protein n=1 Tax=Blastomonas marina TaxID=1867408 RepID=UPI002AC9CB8A|nr:OmpH family outer membrane protein [Blastomonas marina]WPZ05051.1 OmpH family outer membrane protein [Blastomonas marina]
MKFKALTAALALTAGAAAATPAAAQVQGSIAIVNAPAAVAQTQAFQSAYQQIAATYQTQRTTIQERQQQQNTLLQQLDTNSDGNLDENEQRAAQGTPQAQQYAQLDQEIAGLQNQIDRARVYAVEQILRQYSTTVQQIVTQDGVAVLLSPDSVLYAQQGADITPKVVTAINTALPSVQTAIPADWQPSRQAVAVFQQVQQLLMAAAQQAAQQQQPPQTTGDSRM